MTSPDVSTPADAHNNIASISDIATTLADVRELTNNVDQSLAKVLEMLTDIRNAFREAQLAQAPAIPATPETPATSTWVGAP